ncbi:helicase-like transcription factor HLTF/DNA helicase RAD5, DEAD-box superfamily, partial [Myxozyma melibiosi]
MRDIVAGARNGRFGHTEETLKKLPKADQPQRIHTKMLDYQLQGLGWLLQHEHPHLRKNPVHSTQFWHARADGSFYNSMTKQIGAPKLASGGILADDMGLGKTIQMLSLVCADPAAAVKSGLIKADSTPAEFKGKPTLILAPVGLLSNWSDQAAHHIDPDNPLKVLVYYGSSKSRSVNFEDYDVVIGSYGQIRGEYKRLLAIEDPENIRPVNQLPRNMRFIDQPWRRVILDEAHIIRNPNTLVTQGVMRLNAYSRWALTGTPIMNSLTDLFSLVRFLRVSGLMDKQNFESIIKRGFEVKGSDSETRLQALMMEFTLRRLKSMNSLVRLNLPPLTVFTHTIEWSKEERRVYDAMQAEAYGAMMEWHQAARGEGQARLMYLFEALLRLRQICNHQQLCGERLRGIADIEEKEVVEPTHDNIMALQLMLQAAIDENEECPVCFEVLQEPRITLCKHIFCKNCIEETIHMSHKCPYCRHLLTSARDSLIAPMEETGADEVEITEGSSSKLDAIMKILITQKSQNDSMPQEEPIKTVVFSQWTSFLNILEPLLDDAGIKFSRIDGTMKIDERDAAIKQLADDRETTVLLASLAVSSTGLNLTMASQVIMCDLWWNIAQERQAIDRCHRLGQTRPVNVFRLVMKNSIEQRVIKIQEEKEEIVERALND